MTESMDSSRLTDGETPGKGRFLHTGIGHLKMELPTLRYPITSRLIRNAAAPTGHLPCWRGGIRQLAIWQLAPCCTGDGIPVADHTGFLYPKVSPLDTSTIFNKRGSELLAAHGIIACHEREHSVFLLRNISKEMYSRHFGPYCMLSAPYLRNAEKSHVIAGR